MPIPSFLAPDQTTENRFINTGSLCFECHEKAAEARLEEQKEKRLAEIDGEKKKKNKERDGMGKKKEGGDGEEEEAKKGWWC